MPQTFDDVGECVETALRTVGRKVVLALPLGIGKPNPVANEFFRRAAADPAIDLTIITALSLRLPRPSSDLERRLAGPLIQRIFGDYPELEYQRAQAAGRLPPNVRVIEFFLEPGAWLTNQYAQTNYLAANYTHVARELAARGVNVAAHLLSKRQVAGWTEYSLGSNPDVTLDLLPYVQARRARGEPFVFIGATHAEMPFMTGSAQWPIEQIDLLLEHPRYEFPLFAPPNPSLSRVDHAIGMHASALVRDGGTLQIGIGELGDSVCYALLLRHQQNTQYQRALDSLGTEHNAALVDSDGGRAPFFAGLFASTEMLVDQMLDLYRAGVLRRRVYDWLPLQRSLANGRTADRIDARLLERLVDEGVGPHLSAHEFAHCRHFGVFRQDVCYERGRLRADGGDWIEANLGNAECREQIAAQCLGIELRNGRLLHAGFFLGPRAFYAHLRALSESERQLLDMRGVGYINQLDGDDYALKVAQRTHMRCVNTTMMVTTLGAAVSDALADGRVVSGVGGQFNFVNMAHSLPGARSILCVRATRTKNGVVSSNIVTSYGHATIPRHLRDIVVTEYGIADLRGRTDSECIAAMVNIADSRFQASLLADAVRAGKIDAGYRVSDVHRNNTPEALARAMAEPERAGLFSEYPFGTDLTAEEIQIAKVLRTVGAASDGTLGRLKTAVAVLAQRIRSEDNPYLARLGLHNPTNFREQWLSKLVSYALQEFSGR